MRDTYRPIEHWETRVRKRRERDIKNDSFALYESRIPTSEGSPPMFGLFALYTGAWMELVNYQYCRGDDLAVIKAEVVDEGVERYLKVADEIEKYRTKLELDERMFYPVIAEPHQSHSVYTLLSWLICFEIDEERIKALLPYIAPEGKDRIIDTVAARYQPNRVIAETCACPRTHRLLDGMIDGNAAKQVSLATQYLDRWGKLMSTMKGLKALGGAAIAEGAKSNADLAKMSEKKVFKGFWAWELALMVRFFEIDDSSFADHALYPADLAHFRV